MLRYSEFNFLNFKAWNPNPSNSVFVCVHLVGCRGVRGGHSVHPPFMLGEGGVEGGLNLQPNFQKKVA